MRTKALVSVQDTVITLRKLNRIDLFHHVRRYIRLQQDHLGGFMFPDDLYTRIELARERNLAQIH